MGAQMAFAIEITPGVKPAAAYDAGAGASFRMANRRAWIPASQQLDFEPVPAPEQAERVWDQLLGCWVKPVSVANRDERIPAPTRRPQRDGSGVWWNCHCARTGAVVVRIEQRRRVGAARQAERLFGFGGWYLKCGTTVP